MKEIIWKQIWNMPLYEVSQVGIRRINAKHKEPHAMFISPRGYYRCFLYKTAVKKDGKRWQLFHRALAEAFIPNPLNLPQVNHKDGNKLNNDLSNLEWITSRDNLKHAIDNGIHKTKLTQEKANEIRAKFIPYKYSRKKLALEYGVCVDTIQSVIYGETWNW